MAQNKDFAEWADQFHVCVDFVAAYKRANPKAIIKFGHVEGNGHAWIYDPELDRTLDATLGQFFWQDCRDDWWPGERHPIAEEETAYESLEAFANTDGGTYLLEAHR